MECNNTTKCLPIPQCVGVLKLFDIPPYMTGDIYVYIQNLCNDNITKIVFDQEDKIGNLINIEVPIRLMPECEYLLWINENEEIPHETYQFEIEGETATVLQFGVSKVFDSDLTQITNFTTQIMLA